MKAIQAIILVMLFLAAGMVQSCEEKPEVKGKIDFSLSFDAGELLKSVVTDSSDVSDDTIIPANFWQLMVTIVSVDGEVVMEDERIPLFAFGSQFVSEKIELKAGEYLLEKFMVIGPYGNVVYAAPLEGSPKAYLVNRPLPLNFIVKPEQVSHISPEVLRVMNSTPADFGYATFSFNVVRPVIGYVMVVHNDSLSMRPSAAIPAKMVLKARDGWMHEYRLRAGVNKILVKPGYEWYKVMVKNPDYPPYTGEIAAKRLRNSSEERPVVFELGDAAYHQLLLQPGPERGKDAMITDLDPERNFGDHPYFEASFLTEPVLTVMRTKSSLIEFYLNDLPKSATIHKVLLTLSIENMMWDSSVAVAENEDYNRKYIALQQIIEPWEEYKVTWHNQPSTTDANQVIIPLYDIYSNMKRRFDVTSIFVNELDIPNYGMMLKVIADNPYPGGWQFASSDYKIPGMRPELTVLYTLP
jgi:hypothetical protein